MKKKIFSIHAASGDMEPFIEVRFIMSRTSVHFMRDYSRKETCKSISSNFSRIAGNMER